MHSIPSISNQHRNKEHNRHTGYYTLQGQTCVLPYNDHVTLCVHADTVRPVCCHIMTTLLSVCQSCVLPYNDHVTLCVFSDTVRPVCLPKYDLDLPGGTQCWISGWGYTQPDDGNNNHTHTHTFALTHTHTHRAQGQLSKKCGPWNFLWHSRPPVLPDLSALSGL